MKDKLYQEVIKIGSKDLICVASRPGEGKTTILLKLANKLLENNNSLVFVSLELLAELLKLKIQNNDCSQFHIVDVPNLTINELSNIIKKIMKNTKVDYVFIDYIQLLNCDMKMVNKLLKELATILNVPFIVSSQLPRNYNEINIKKENKEYTKIFIIKDFKEYEIL